MITLNQKEAETILRVIDRARSAGIAKLCLQPDAKQTVFVELQEITLKPGDYHLLPKFPYVPNCIIAGGK